MVGEEYVWLDTSKKLFMIFAYMVIFTPVFGYMVFGNMVIFGFMVNFPLVPTWTIYPGASVLVIGGSPDASGMLKKVEL